MCVQLYAAPRLQYRRPLSRSVAPHPTPRPSRGLQPSTRSPISATSPTLADPLDSLRGLHLPTRPPARLHLVSKGKVRRRVTRQARSGPGSLRTTTKTPPHPPLRSRKGSIRKAGRRRSPPRSLSNSASACGPGCVLAASTSSRNIPFAGSPNTSQTTFPAFRHQKLSAVPHTHLSTLHQNRWPSIFSTTISPMSPWDGGASSCSAKTTSALGCA